VGWLKDEWWDSQDKYTEENWKDIWADYDDNLEWEAKQEVENDIAD
jgi:hypothetical protein